MRPGVCLAFCLALLAVGSASAATHAAKSPTHGAVAFWTADRGLVGTGAAFCSGPCGKGTVQLTRNGGKTWTQVLKTPDAIVSLDVAGSASAWAVANHCDTLRCRSKVWRSSNGGRTWSVVASGLTSVSFANARTGLGTRSTPLVSKLFRSDNGGRAWRPVKSPCGDLEPIIQSVSLVTPRQGYVICTGQAAAGAQNKTVFVTSNGGTTWTRRIRAELGSGRITSLPVNGYITGADFAPSGLGAICQVQGVFLVSRNAGKTWTPVKVVRPRLDTCMATATAPGTAFAIISTRLRDRLVKTTNGGRKWTVVKRF